VLTQAVTEPAIFIIMSYKPHIHLHINHLYI